MTLDGQIAEKLRCARREAGLSVSDAAQKIGKSELEIRRLESGVARIGADLLYRASVEYDVEIRWFFDDADVGDPLKTEPASKQIAINQYRTTILANLRANNTLAELCDLARESEYKTLARSKVA